VSPAAITKAALVAAVALVFAIVATGGEDPYTIKLRMDNAGGLKDGSPVTVGGVKIGKVDVDVEDGGGAAIASLRIDDEHAPIGRDTKATIVAQNLLGQKQLQLTTGSKDDPAPDGFVVPRSRVTEATDLDQVLNVLDADTRTRLAIFVNEAGTAFTGRRADFNRFLKDIAPAITSSTDLVGQLAADNRQLGSLLETSDRYVAEVTARRDEVVRFVDRVGQAATTGATKRTELRRTLGEAPGALRQLRTFLGELRATTVPLGPAARQLTAAATPLQTTLDQLEPFRKAAEPALRSATRVAPSLTQLATRATPVLRSAVPTASAVKGLAADDLPPVLDTSDRSINNTLAVLDNWADAIQYRDRLGHIFRGEASFAPDLLQSAIERLTPTPAKRRPSGTKQPAAPRPSGGGSAPAPAKPSLPKVPEITLPGLPPIKVPEVGKLVDDVLGGLGVTKQGDGRPSLLEGLIG